MSNLVTQNEAKKKDFYVVRNATTGDVVNVVFPNGIQVGIQGVTNFNSGIVLPNLSSAPANTTNTLYVIDGNVYFGGQLIGNAVDENQILASQVFG